MQQLLDEQMRRKLDRLENSELLNPSKIHHGSDSDSSSSNKNSPMRKSRFFDLLSHLRRKPAASPSPSPNSSEQK